MGGYGRGCGGYLPLPTEYGCVVGTGKDGVPLHVETVDGTLVVEDASCQLKNVVSDRDPRVVKGNQVSNHIRRLMRPPHGVMNGGQVHLLQGSTGMSLQDTWMVVGPGIRAPPHTCTRRRHGFP